MFENWEKAKKVWVWLGTFGIVKPLGLLTIGVLASGGVEAGARAASQTLHWVLGILAGLAGVGLAVLTHTWRREGVTRRELFGRKADRWLYVLEPERPKPVPAPEPEPWTWTAEVLQTAPAALDAPRVFIAGEIIERKDVEHA